MNTRKREKTLRDLKVFITRQAQGTKPHGSTTGRGLMSADVPRLGDNRYVLGDDISVMMAIPGILGAWSFSSITGNDLIDYSGHANTLTNNGPAPFISSRLISCANLNGSTMYFSSPTETVYDITGPLAFGGWFKFDALAAVNIFNKFGAVGNYAFTVYNSPGNLFVAAVSGDGTALTQIATTETTVANKWYFVGLSYSPSTSLSLFVNGTRHTNTTSIPAAIFNSSAALQIGGNTALSQYLDGKVSRCWISDAPVSNEVFQSVYERQKWLFD